MISVIIAFNITTNAIYNGYYTDLKQSLLER